MKHWKSSDRLHLIGSVFTENRLNGQVVCSQESSRSGTRHLTYTALLKRAYELSRRIENNFEIPTGIAVRCMRGINSVVGQATALLLGVPFFNVDPRTPDDIVVSRMKLANANILLRSEGDISELASHDLPVHYFNIPGASTTPTSDADVTKDVGSLLQKLENAQTHCSPEDAQVFCYAFTSGTTGGSKAIRVSHSNVRNFFSCAATSPWCLQQGDVSLSTAAVEFDIYTHEVWGSLLGGSTLSFVSQEELLDPILLGEAIKRFRVSKMFLASGLFRRLMQTPRVFGHPLMELLVGGDVVPVYETLELLRYRPDLRIVSAYGPAECTFWALYHEVKFSSVDEPLDRIPIGLPIAATKVGILPIGNEDHSEISAVSSKVNWDPLPNSSSGVNKDAEEPEGELVLGGKCVALGYRMESESTSSNAFFHDARHGGVAYRTGDIVRLTKDGVFEYLGRMQNSDFVKVRGQRISLRQVEKWLSDHGLKSCVRPRKHSSETTYSKLVAVYIRTSDSDKAIEAIKKHTGSYFLPNVFVPCEDIPTNKNGKVDTAAVDDIITEYETQSQEMSDGSDDNIGDGDDVLRAVMEAMEEVLNTRVGVNDDIVFCGFTSVTVPTFTQALRKKLPGLSLQVLDVMFECATPMKIAERIRELDSSRHPREPPVTSPVTSPTGASLLRLSEEHKGCYVMSFNIPHRLWNIVMVPSTWATILRDTPMKDARLKILHSNIEDCGAFNEEQWLTYTNTKAAEILRNGPEDPILICTASRYRSPNQFLNVTWCVHHCNMDGKSTNEVLRRLDCVLNGQDPLAVVEASGDPLPLPNVEHLKRSVEGHYKDVRWPEASVCEAWRRGTMVDSSFEKSVLKLPLKISKDTPNQDPSFVYKCFAAWLCMLQQYYEMPASNFVCSGRAPEQTHSLLSSAVGLPVAVDLSSGVTFGEMIRTVRTVVGLAEKCSSCIDPLEYRTLSNAPGIPFAFTYHEIDEDGVVLSDMVHFPLAMAVTKFRTYSTIEIHSRISGAHAQQLIHTFSRWLSLFDERDNLGTSMSPHLYPTVADGYEDMPIMDMQQRASAYWEVTDYRFAQMHRSLLSRCVRPALCGNVVTLCGLEEEHRLSQMYKAQLQTSGKYAEGDVLNCCAKLLHEYVHVLYEGSDAVVRILVERKTPGGRGFGVRDFDVSNDFKMSRVPRNDEAPYYGIMDCTKDSATAVVLLSEQPSDELARHIMDLYRTPLVIGSVTNECGSSICAWSSGTPYGSRCSMLFTEKGLSIFLSELESLLSNRAPIQAELCHVGADPMTIRSSTANIVDMFLTACRADPEATAVSVRDTQERRTFKQLDDLSNRLARKIVAVIGPGGQEQKVVAVICPRSIQLYICELAVMRCGHILFPIDPSNPEGRVEMLTSLARPSLVLHSSTGPSFGDVQQMDVSTVHELSTEGNFQDELSDEFPSSLVCDMHTMAYLVFTSGSTGTPKGVCVAHNTLNSMFRNTFGFAYRRGDVSLPACSVQFDMGIMEGLGALCNGASVVVVKNEEINDTDRLETILREEKVTKIIFTAALFHSIGASRPTALQPLDAIAVGGDVTSAQIIRDVMRACPGTNIVPGWGPTECTIASTFATHIPALAASAPIGRPVDGEGYKAVGTNGKPVRRGTPGELVMFGSGVALGYWDCEQRRPRESETDGGFIRKGAITEYRTGDIVVEGADRQLYFLGRKGKSQVKIWGYRVDLSEVKAALERCPSVREAYVYAHENGVQNEKELIGFCIPTRAHTSGPDILAELQGDIPSYMKPRSVFVIDSFPLNTHQKIDSRQLAEMVNQEPDQPSSVQQSLMNFLRMTYQDCRDSLTVETSFTELGVDSLNRHFLIDAVRKACQRLGKPIPDGQALRSCDSCKDIVDLVEGRVPALLKRSIERPQPELSADGIAIVAVSARTASSVSLEEFETVFINGTREYAASEHVSGSTTDILHRGDIMNCVRDSLSHTKINPETLTGVFAVGEYETLEVSEPEDPLHDPVLLAQDIANEIGIAGPVHNVHAACASGLLCVHQACRALRAGDCTAAVCAAIFSGHARDFKVPVVGELLSRTGKFRAFDKRGDGGVTRNACVSFVLKSLEQAAKDGDDVLAVIEGTAEHNDASMRNQSGPTGQSHSVSLEIALQQSSCSGDNVRYVEMSSSGEPVLDSIEVEAIVKVFPDDANVVLGTAKSNVGATEMCSGLMSLLRAVSSVRTGKLYKTPGHKEPIDILQHTNLKVLNNTIPWNDDERYAAVMSYGFGGTCVSVIVRNSEYETQSWCEN